MVQEEGRWTQGTSLGGKGQYRAMISETRPDGGARADQVGMGSSIAA